MVAAVESWNRASTLPTGEEEFEQGFNIAYGNHILNKLIFIVERAFFFWNDNYYLACDVA